MADFVKSPLNYTGGKYKLLPQIMPLFPTNIDTFVDLFCGGGNVGINTLANHIIYNDKNHCLIELLKVFDTYDYQTIETKIEDNILKFHLSDAGRYGYAYYGCESSRGLGNYNKAPYMDLRKAFNEAEEKNDD